MSTLAQMRTRIADDLNRSDLNTQIDKAINRAIEFYYNSESFWFNETTGTFSTIASQESYGTADGVPSDIGSIHELVLTISSTNKPKMIRRSYGWIKEMNVGSPTGNPLDYAWYANKIWLHLIPNSVKTITISYRKTYPTVLSSDSDTNDYTAYAEDLIEARARGWLARRILQDEALKQGAMEEELIALMALRKRTESMIATGSTPPTQF